MRYTFKALKGTQGGKSFFQLMLPFHILGQVVTVNPEVQRKMSTRRVKGIYEYICNNQNAFYFPNITLAAPGNLDWSERTGTLSWDDSMKLSAVDGQHRYKGIMMLMESPLGEIFSDHHLGATVYGHMQTEKQADMFSVVNGEQKPVTKAVRELRNHHSMVNRVTRDVILNLQLSEKTEWQTGTIKDREGKWFAFTWMLEANRHLLQALGNTDELNAARIVSEYWNTVFEVLRRNLGRPQEDISSSAAVFLMLGAVGKRFITEDNAHARLLGLAKINWSRVGGSFENILLTNGHWRRGVSSHSVSSEARRVLEETLNLRV